MNDQTIATLVGLAVLVVLRLVDALLPKGRHFRFIDRWLSKDTDDDPDAD